MKRIVSWFKKDVPIEKVLEEIDLQINAIQKRRTTYKSNWRNRIYSLLVYSVLIELIYLLVFYFYLRTLTKDPVEQGIYASPLLIWPLIAYILKNLVNGYYNRRVLKDDALLENLIKTQKEKLEELAKATKYLETQKLLQKYAKTINEQKEEPPKRTPTPATPQPTPNKTAPRAPATPQPTPENQELLRQQRLLEEKILEQQRQLEMLKNAGNRGTFSHVVIDPNREVISEPSTPATPRGMPVPRDRLLPTPIKTTNDDKKKPDPNRPWYDKFVDYLIGDTVSETVPVHCTKCRAQNGFAPREDALFIQFLCKSCGHVNVGQEVKEEAKESKQEEEKPKTE